MVKGISRQVIVVHAPEPKLFEQAIFILKDGAIGAEGVTDDALMKEARQLLNSHASKRHRSALFAGPLWAFGGAAVTALVWLFTVLA
ncbi:MAG: translation initiation factor 2 [Oscillospiraceae bacterium]|nr:translation initiation factor 2 [Oscillospiraceae bacterium]